MAQGRRAASQGNLQQLIQRRLQATLANRAGGGGMMPARPAMTPRPLPMPSFGAGRMPMSPPGRGGGGMLPRQAPMRPMARGGGGVTGNPQARQMAMALLQRRQQGGGGMMPRGGGMMSAGSAMLPRQAPMRPIQALNPQRQQGLAALLARRRAGLA